MLAPLVNLPLTAAAASYGLNRLLFISLVSELNYLRITCNASPTLVKKKSIITFYRM